jgi:hypothetical protein
MDAQRTFLVAPWRVFDVDAMWAVGHILSGTRLARSSALLGALGGSGMIGPAVMLRRVLSARVLPWAHLTAALTLLGLGVGPATQAWHEARLEAQQPETIPAAEFSRIVREFSEEDGFFRSDNFVSNETSYLHIVDKLRELEATGGAYVGVGPEQNFTYIAKVRPRIAFIIDIRRQAIVQHLMFKALFQLSDNRVQFLSRLFSKPVTGEKSPAARASVEQMLDFFTDAPSSEEAYTANLAAIRRTIESDFQFPLSARDQAALDYVYGAFREENLNIQYRTGGTNWGNLQWSRFPNLKDIILQPDLHGNLGNFLASDSDYAFVRDLHRRNRIIPVVGDFAGPKALVSIGDYLKKNGYSLTAFYTSNVEQYLFASATFSAFVDNVRKLPISEKSLFIRAFPNMREPHPAQIPPHRLTTLLQKMTVCLKDYDDGAYDEYWKLVTLHYIAPEQP